MSNHALLSPSASWRWLNCPPSARLGENIPEEPSVYAEEGTEAHKLCEQRARAVLRGDNQLFFPKTDGFKFYSAEMNDASAVWAEVIRQRIEACKPNAWHAFVEEDYDLTRWIPEGHGTADFTLISNDTLEVMDFKYGKGVPVFAENNTQMMCYALGALDRFGSLYDIKTVRMAIVQPRLDNISVWSVGADELLAWGESTLIPMAVNAFEGVGKQKAGEWCRFCKVRPQCRTWFEKAEEMMQDEVYDKRLLTNEEIERVLPKLDDLISWAQEVKEYALMKALRNEKFKGFKLVAGRSTRGFKDESLACQRMVGLGYDPFEAPKMVSVAKAEKLMGKKSFDTVLGDLVEKSAGKPVLVPESDKRPEWNSAVNEFGIYSEEESNNVK